METKTETQTQAEADTKRQQEELAQLVARAEQGDRGVLPALQEALDANPAVWQQYGDLALQAEASLGVLAAGKNLLLGESLKRKLQWLKAELGGESPSPLERLLVERAVMSWLQTAYYDTLLSQARGASEAQARMLHRQQDAAYRRQLAALRTLATVRKLLTPAPSPLDFSTRLGRPGAGAHSGREGVAGRVPVRN